MMRWPSFHLPSFDLNNLMTSDNLALFKNMDEASLANLIRTLRSDETYRSMARQIIAATPIAFAADIFVSDQIDPEKAAHFMKIIMEHIDDPTEVTMEVLRNDPFISGSSEESHA